MKGKLVVAIADNPNCWKTTLFNGLMGGRQRIGNWPGVTVEKKEGAIRSGKKKALLVDIPGIYSLSASSEDEKTAGDLLVSGQADLVINIVDAVNIERNIYLAATQIAEMKVAMLIIINRADIASKSKTAIDHKHLSKQPGSHVIMISAIKNIGIKNASEAIFSSLENLKIPVVNIK